MLIVIRRCVQGKRQVNTMLRKFSAEDAAMAGQSAAQVPEWTMKMPGIGSKAIVRFRCPLCDAEHG